MTPDEGDSGDGKVLTPNELDLKDKDGVEEIEDGRFVVSPDGSQPDVAGVGSDAEPTAPESPSADTEPADTEEREPADRPESEAATPSVPDTDDLAEQRGHDITRSDVRDWTTEQLESTACEYGYHLSLKAGDDVRHHTLHSDDVSMVFNNLLLWYAQTVDSELPPGAVLGILLMEANVQIRYPVKSIEQLLLNYGLSPEDPVAELLQAVREDDEVVFPPRDT